MDEIKLIKSSNAKLGTLDSKTIAWLDCSSTKNSNKINNF